MIQAHKASFLMLMDHQRFGPAFSLLRLGNELPMLVIILMDSGQQFCSGFFYHEFLAITT